MTEWTTETPTTAGWYWVRWPAYPQLGPEIKAIEQPNGPDTDELVVNDMPIDEYVKDCRGVEWQPVTVPREDNMTEPIQEAVLIERGLYEQVVEGLRRIAEPDQEPFMTTTDAIRALSATLKMLNAGRDIAQRLLTQLTEKQS